MEKNNSIPLCQIRADMNVNLIINRVSVRAAIFLLFSGVSVSSPLANSCWGSKIGCGVTINVYRDCGSKCRLYSVEDGLQCFSLRGCDYKIKVSMIDFLRCLAGHSDMLKQILEAGKKTCLDGVVDC